MGHGAIKRKLMKITFKRCNCLRGGGSLRGKEFHAQMAPGGKNAENTLIMFELIACCQIADPPKYVWIQFNRLLNQLVNESPVWYQAFCKLIIQL